jgi:hypothetical protein
VAKAPADMVKAAAVFAAHIAGLPRESSLWAIEETIESEVIPNFGGTPDFWLLK